VTDAVAVYDEDVAKNEVVSNLGLLCHRCLGNTLKSVVKMKMLMMLSQVLQTIAVPFKHCFTNQADGDVCVGCNWDRNE
jgi:hypothetical protein